MTSEHARELLAATHPFPGVYTIKAIGRARPGFVDHIVQAARCALERAADVQHSVRTTPQGRHVAVTLQLSVLTPEEVLAVYAALKTIEGLSLLL